MGKRKCPWMVERNKRLATHKMTKTRTYGAWRDMRQRCLNPKNPRFKDYGARGITICARWDHFELFLSDMGIKPAGKSLGRKDNNAGYSPENCRWETRSEQQRNRRTNRILTFGGLSLPVIEWAERLGVTSNAIQNRLRNNWPIEKVLNYGRHSSKST